MATLRGISLGTVDEIRVNPLRTFSSVEQWGNAGVYQQNHESETHSLSITGFLSSPTQEEMEKIKTIRDGEVAFVSISEYNYFQWVKVTGTPFIFRGGSPGVFNYRIQCKPVPCVGYTRALTADMGFSDKSYQRLVRRYNPFSARHAVFHASFLTHQHELYVINLKDSEQTLEFEMDCGDDLHMVEIWGWKDTAWDKVATWTSGSTEFGVASGWTDEDDVSHNFRVNHAPLGTDVADFTKDLTEALGTYRRVALQIASMAAYDGAPVSSDHGTYQLLLRVKLTHTEREGARPYTIVTMRDGGFGLGPA